MDPTVAAFEDDSSSDDDFDPPFLLASAAMLGCAWLLAEEQGEARRTGGSRPGKMPNRERFRERGAVQIDRDYFCRLPQHSQVQPVFNDIEFHRRFSLSRASYDKIRSRILSNPESYFSPGFDATGKPSATTDQKLLVSFLMLTQGCSADECVEYSRLAEPTCLACLKNFTAELRALFEAEWLRLPNAGEIETLSKEFSQLGFPGCIGALDCASWFWDLCPIGLQGKNMSNKEKRPNVRMEAVCDDYLRIWYLNFGCPGSKNDVQILSNSSLFNMIRTAEWPSFRQNIVFPSGFTLKWFYYLVDGIYPQLRFLMQSIGFPFNRKDFFTASSKKAREK